MLEPHGPSGIVQILAVESPDLASLKYSIISVNKKLRHWVKKTKG
jgi:hypothetical protein